MSDENTPDPVAALDQARRGLADLLALLAAYRAECEAQGFSRKEALALVIEYQRLMLTMGQSAE